MRYLTISRSSVRFVKDGHPWIRVDRFTKGLDQLKTGEAVCLVDEKNKPIASALADPDQEICARVYHKAANKDFAIHSALDRAKEKRQALLDDEDTNCFRLVHGESDFIPGLRIELLGPVVLILLRAPCIKVYLNDIIQWCAKHFPELEIIIKEHMDDLRKHPLRSYGPNEQSLDPKREYIGKELGTEVIITPCADLATGVYVDQRATRAFLRQHCIDKSIANAFAYTGLFSSSLLQAGAKHAVDIDIAAPSLETAQRNAALNHVADKHTIAVQDSIQYFKEMRDTFDIIILDPPTAAHGKGKNQWILRKHYPQLLEVAANCLNDQGFLVACCNTLGNKKQFALKQHLTQHFNQFELLTNPPIGADIPITKGFPESSPYQLLIARAHK